MSLPGMAFHIYLQSQNNLATSEKKRRHVFLKHAEVISFMNADAWELQCWNNQLKDPSDVIYQGTLRVAVLGM